MRIVVDLQACQTEASAGRGVGRFAEGLARHLAGRMGSDDLRLCLSGAYRDSLERTVDAWALLLPRQCLTAYRYPDPRPGTAQRRAECAIAETLIRHHWMSLQPDVLHISHVFEGWHGAAIVPHALPKASGLVRSATLYDLIPLRFPEHYFADPEYKAWYFEKLGTLRDCDRILAISESTRSDAIDLLGIDPARIDTIWGGADSLFRRQSLSAQEVDALRARYGLKRRFVLYAGGDEYRKNLDGALAGFAELTPKLRRDTQFVIVCALDASSRNALLGKAAQRGFAADDLVLPGYIDEADLVGLYNLCDAFVFPSLYEGFGLPLLEAMACGAPVLAANNSSLPEIVGRSDALFDTLKPGSLAERLAKVLEDEAFRGELRRHGVERAKAFTWERSARLAMEALRDAHDRLARRDAVVAAAALGKKRLALFTPLPPCRSGIADYNAAFLPYLSRYFSIDLFVDDYEVSDAFLRSNFVIRPHREFAARSDDYDAVLFEMGNSEFHAYMLDYLERYPGIVILHDAFLSGLYGYVDFHLGDAGRYSKEMLGAHGPRARRYLAPVQANKDPIFAAMVNLPASRSVIESAIGVISHTPYNIDLAQANYPEGWAAPYRIVKQMVRIPVAASAAHRNALRAELGFREGDFIVCTFGHVAWNKCGDLLFEAFAKSALASDPNAKLVYVGELARDAFGHGLRRAIEDGELREQVRISGYLDEAAYAKYLAAADLAVQLRKQSRGGASKAILDCLVHGIPVIANDAANFKDYPEGVIQKVGAEPDVAELAGKLTSLYQRRVALPQLGNAGREYALREHDPETIAARYAMLIDEFLQKARAAALPTAIGEIGGILTSPDSQEQLLERSAIALQENLSRNLFARQRILIDVSYITDRDHETGIPRVVRNIVRWLYCSDRAGFVPVAVRLEGGALVEATEWLDAQGLLLPVERQGSDGRVVEFEWGDCLLMLDSSWARFDEFLPVFESLRRVQGKVYTVVYDLLPIRFPQYVLPEGPAWFRKWVLRAIDVSDGLLCISRAAADDLHDFIRSVEPESLVLDRLGYWHLGSDFAQSAVVDAHPTDRVLSATSGCSFLMVGSLEPRKNHALALDAMELLWARGVEASLCIAGKPGWMVDDLIARLSDHPESGRRLHYIERPTDKELGACYARSAALLFPTAGEGFGLPLVEAARFGTPILASDIPVLHEIAGDHATYFRLGSAAELADVLETWLAEASHGNVPQSRGMPCLTWEESAEQLLDVVLGNRWYKFLANR